MVIVICTFLVTNDVTPLFMCLFNTCVSSLVKCDLLCGPWPGLVQVFVSTQEEIRGGAIDKGSGGARIIYKIEYPLKNLSAGKLQREWTTVNKVSALVQGVMGWVCTYVHVFTNEYLKG